MFSFQFLCCCIQRDPSHLILKQLGRKDFQWSNLSRFLYVCYYVKKKIIFQLINKSLFFNLITI